MKPGKQRCQDFCWKVHDRAKSFVVRSYTVHELRNQNISIGQFLGQKQATIVFCALSRPK